MKTEPPTSKGHTTIFPLNTDKNTISHFLDGLVQFRSWKLIHLKNASQGFELIAK